MFLEDTWHRPRRINQSVTLYSARISCITVGGYELLWVTRVESGCFLTSADVLVKSAWSNCLSVHILLTKVNLNWFFCMMTAEGGLMLHPSPPPCLRALAVEI